MMDLRARGAKKMGEASAEVMEDVLLRAQAILE